MKAFPGHRLFVGLAAAGVLSLVFAATAVAFVFDVPRTDELIHRVQGAVTVSPNTVETGSSPTVNINASGFFDLSQVQDSQIGIRPSQGVSGIQINGATAQTLRLSFTLAPETVTGTRTLFINNSSGTTVVALDLFLRPGAAVCAPACRDPLVCRAGVCAQPGGCDPPCDDGFRCNQINRCVAIMCQPRCGSNEDCINGFCQIRR